MEKIEVFYKSFQVISSKQITTDNDIYEVIYCADDNEYRVCSDICDNLCIERCYKNHLKSGTYTNNF